MNIRTSLLVTATILSATGCFTVKTESEIKPIHITMDVNLKVDKELDKAFADENMAKPKGDFAEVKRLCSGVAQQPVRDPHGMMLDALAIVAMREGQYLAAVHYFTMGLKVAKRNHSPDHSLLNLGLCLANLGKDHEALAVLSKAAQCGNPTVRGRAVEAMEAIRRTVARAPFEWR